MFSNCFNFNQNCSFNPCRWYLKTDTPYSKTTSIYKHSLYENKKSSTKGWKFAWNTWLNAIINRANRRDSATKKHCACEKWKWFFFSQPRANVFPPRLIKISDIYTKCAIKIWSAFNHLRQSVQNHEQFNGRAIIKTRASITKYNKCIFCRNQFSQATKIK